MKIPRETRSSFLDCGTLTGWGGGLVVPLPQSVSTPNKHNKRGDRRARQNKRSGNNKISIDLDTQNARLQMGGNDSLTWSVLSDPIPRFGRTSRFDNKIFNVVQTINPDNTGNPTPVFTSSTSIFTYYTANITLANQVTQYTSWTNVFDQYRIMEVECWVRPLSGTSGTVDTNGANYAVVVDYDDDNNVSNFQQLLQYENAIVAPLTNGIYRKFRPHNATAAYNGAFTGYQNTTGAWIDSASPSVRYYGLKMGCEISSVAYKFMLTYRLWIQFRNTF